MKNWTFFSYPKRQVYVDGYVFGSFDSSPYSEYTSYDVNADGATRFTLEAIGLGAKEWISLLEVRGGLESDTLVG